MSPLFQVRKEYSKVRRGVVQLQAIYRMRRQQSLYGEMKTELRERRALEAEAREAARARRASQAERIRENGAGSRASRRASQSGNEEERRSVVSGDIILLFYA